jgi:hypothetical protein
VTEKLEQRVDRLSISTVAHCHTAADDTAQ